MLPPLGPIVFSSRHILLAASLLIGIFAIFASVFAITSGRWVHVFRSLPVEAELTSSPREDNSHTLQQVEPKTQRNGSEEHNKGTDEALRFTTGCQEKKGRTGSHCGLSTADRGSHCADDAYAGLYTVCLLNRCTNGSDGTGRGGPESEGEGSGGAGRSGGAVCLQCSTANDPSFKRRTLCHVVTIVMAISADSHKTLVIYALATVILICGVCLGIVGNICGRFYLILGAFFHTTAGLLQFLAMFLFATVVTDALGEDSQVQPGYNYDWGSISAVFAFTATNLAAVLTAYSYRGRHQLDQKKQLSSSLPEASIGLAKSYEHS